MLLTPVTNHTAQALVPSELPQVGYHPGGVAYWSNPYFANALYNGGGWMEFAPGEWGASLSSWNSPQFDSKGYPQYLNPGMRLRAIIFPLHAEYGNRPSTWPRRSATAEGKIVLTWQGNADIRLGGGGSIYLGGDSGGAETGSLTNGRRSYLFQGGSTPGWIEIHAIDAGNPISDIKVWLPDPSDPNNSALEGGLYHPVFLERLADADWGFIRFMDLQHTNANPQQDWSDRRPPGHVFMSGALNPREPATGSPGNRGSGMAFEQMIALSNAAAKDMWICVPHLATDDFIRKLAQMIRFGSDGVNPYTSQQANPVHPPLNADLKVYVEYSNEIWAGGYSFPQGDWAQEQANGLGITKPQFNARRFCQVWSIFQEVFGGAERLVRTAAVFTAADWYTSPFLTEMAAYGPTLTPGVEPDIIAATTYFGNGIQDFVFDQAVQKAGGVDPWFATGESFDAGGGNMRPVTVPGSDAYWLSPEFERHQGEAFREWGRRLLAGDASEGAGPDAVGIGGGFANWLRDLAQTTFPTPKPIVAYEGGPSLYTDDRDGGDSRDDGLTTFIEAMNRRPEMAEVYAMHLNMAKSKGLRTHVGFVDAGAWGKYGQWGHLEYMDQMPQDSVKYSFLLDWITEMEGVRHIDDPQGAVPQFDTDHYLPDAVFGQPYSADISVSGGDGARSIKVIGKHMLGGLQLDTLPGNADLLRISGTPTESGKSYVYLRVVDADGDPAWRTFSLRAVGEADTLAELDFSGQDPALNLPITRTYLQNPALAAISVDLGAGGNARSGDGALVWHVDAPGDAGASTLSLALQEDEYISIMVQPAPGETLNLSGRTLRFAIRRIDYHAPRYYAVMSSINGFSAGSEIYTTPYNNDMGTTREYAFTLPNSQAYATINGPLEFRIYAYGGQWGGHRTSLTAFQLNGIVGARASDSEPVPGPSLLLLLACAVVGGVAVERGGLKQ
jgi:hypothetical protein